MASPAAVSVAAADETQPLLSPSATAASDATSETVRSMGSAEDDERQDIGLVRGLVIFVALALLIFFQAMNLSFLTTTQSTIAADLDAFDSVSWFTSAYLVTMSSLGPLTGRLSTIFSPRACILVSSTIFASGSLMTAFSRTLPVFLAGRALTGAGAGSAAILAIILILQFVSTKKRGLAIGLLNAGFTSGVAMGAVFAGALLPRMGWRAIFWIQAPVTFISGVSMFVCLPASFGTKISVNAALPLSRTLASIDYAGAVTLTSGLTLVLLSLSHTDLPFLPLLLGLGLLAVFVLIENWIAPDPIIPVSVLKSRGILLSCASTIGFMMARWLVLFYTPVYAIAVRGWAPAVAGTVLIPTNAGFGLGGLLVGILHIKRAGSFYGATLITYTIFPITLALLAFSFSPSCPVWAFIMIVFANGLTVGAALIYVLAHLLHLTPIQSHFIATSLLGTARGFAGSFSSAIGGGIFARILGANLQKENLEGDLIRRLLGSPALVHQLPVREKEIAVLAYATALRGLFITAAAFAVIMVAVQAGTGWSGQAEEEVGEQEEGIAESGDGIVGPVPPILGDRER